MARGKFGERLKRERELREVSLDELSKATRISNRFLQALENEDWAKLPGGVFGHGFVRSIARYLGLSEESLLGEYDLARAENLPPAPSKPVDPIPSPPKWVPVGALLGGLVFLVAVFSIAKYGWHRTSHTAKQSAAATASSFRASAGASSSPSRARGGNSPAPLPGCGTQARSASRGSAWPPSPRRGRAAIRAPRTCPPCAAPRPDCAAVLCAVTKNVASSVAAAIDAMSRVLT